MAEEKKPEGVDALLEAAKALDENVDTAMTEISRAIVRTDPEDKEIRDALFDGLAAVTSAADDAVEAAVRTATGDEHALDGLKERLAAKSAALTESLDRLPENRTYYATVGKNSYDDLDRPEKDAMYDHLVARLGPAVTEGFLRDKGCASVDELDDAQRTMLDAKIAAETAKWRR